MMNYKEAVEEIGQRLADACLEAEYNQFICGIERAAAAFYPFDVTDDYTDYLETIGHRKVKANYEVLYRMEEGI